MGDMYTESRPWISEAIATHQEQAAELNEDLKRRGVNGEYTMVDRVIGGRRVPAGTFLAYSRKARNEELKDRGFRDNDAGYGDFAGD